MSARLSLWMVSVCHMFAACARCYVAARRLTLVVATESRSLGSWDLHSWLFPTRDQHFVDATATLAAAPLPHTLCSSFALNSVAAKSSIPQRPRRKRVQRGREKHSKRGGNFGLSCGIMAKSRGAQTGGLTRVHVDTTHLGMSPFALLHRRAVSCRPMGGGTDPSMT